MALSQNQFMSIINSYDQVRRNNHMEEQRRKEEVYASIPEIRHIDEKIAHISVEKAKKMIFDKNADERESLKSEIYDLSMEKINLLVIHHYPADYLDPRLNPGQPFPNNDANNPPLFFNGTDDIKI